VKGVGAKGRARTFPQQHWKVGREGGKEEKVLHPPNALIQRVSDLNILNRGLYVHMSGILTHGKRRAVTQQTQKTSFRKCVLIWSRHVEPISSMILNLGLLERLQAPLYFLRDVMNRFF
jgi:hypothetical protein